VFTTIFNIWFATDTTLQHSADGWWIRNSQDTFGIRLPRPQTAVRFSQQPISTRLSIVRDKYQYPEFVMFEEDDMVVDIGAFIGEFAISVAGDAGDVLAIEPDPVNFEALKSTIASFDNIRAENHLLWEEEQSVKFSVATDGSESSIFDPNIGGQEDTENRQTTRFDAVVESPIDFVKVEAEGAELEIIRGFGELEIAKIAVDCSEPNPRIGTSPQKAIQEYLSNQGYTVKITEKEIHGTMLFARHPEAA
jgi:FkbM family methyltransferase